MSVHEFLIIKLSKMTFYFNLYWTFSNFFGQSRVMMTDSISLYSVSGTSDSIWGRTQQDSKATCITLRDACSRLNLSRAPRSAVESNGSNAVFSEAHHKRSPQSSSSLHSQDLLSPALTPTSCHHHVTCFYVYPGHRSLSTRIWRP